MEIKFNIILTMHINICQYRTKLPHAPKVKIMNLLTITYKCTCIGKLIGAAGMGAVNLLNKIYSYFGVIGAADTSIHDAGQATFHCTCSLSQSIFGMSIECCTELYQLPQISPGAVQFCSVTV